MSGERTPDLELLAQQVVAGIMARAWSGWHWRVAAVAAGIAAVVVLAGALASLLGR